MSKASDHKRPQSAKAFTLVEIVLSMGIVSFALVSILGLLSVGMDAFSKVIDNSVGAHVAQKVIAESGQVDFEILVRNPAGGVASIFSKPERYFTDQGDELPSAAGAVYRVNTRVLVATELPLLSGVAQNPDLATVTVQVARYAGTGRLGMASAPGLGNLWDGSIEGNSSSGPVVPIMTYSAQVARAQ